MSSKTEPEIPEVPNLDDRMIRRAITRGVVRTAVVAVLWLLVLSVIGQFLSAGLQRGFGRDDRFQRVAATGLVVAHPEYRWSGGGCCNTTLLTMTVDVTLTPRTGSPNPPDIDVWVAQNALGHVDPVSAIVPQTALGMLASGGLPPRPVAERVMGQLPEGMLASGVVAFRRPLDQAALTAFLRRMGASSVLDLGLILAWAPTGPTDSPGPIGPVGWQTPNPSGTGSIFPTVDSFRTWVSSLTSADDANLAAVGVPAVATLRQLADAGVVVGIVMGGQPVSRFQRMLADREVRSVGLGDVAFDLGSG